MTIRHRLIVGRALLMIKKRAFQVIIILFTALVIGLNVYSWNARTFVKNPLPMPFGFGTCVVLSGSMEPNLSVNDLIIVKETKDVEVDDFVVFQSDASVVVHRCVSVSGDTVVTKGDANNTTDSAISLENDVKGVVVFTIPAAGYITNAIGSPVGVMIIVVAAFVLLELSYKKERRSDEDDLDELRRQIEELKQEQEKGEG